MRFEKLIKQLKVDEGFQGKPYLDTVGILTIGYGRNLIDNPLTNQEGESLLVNDLVKAERDAFTLTYFENLNKPRRDAILNMIYNLGFARFREFKRMAAAIHDENYVKAANEMIESKWSRQVGARSFRLAKMMRTGEYLEDL